MWIGGERQWYGVMQLKQVTCQARVRNDLLSVGGGRGTRFATQSVCRIHTKETRGGGISGPHNCWRISLAVTELRDVWHGDYVRCNSLVVNVA